MYGCSTGYNQKRTAVVQLVGISVSGQITATVNGVPGTVTSTKVWRSADNNAAAGQISGQISTDYVDGAIIADVVMPVLRTQNQNVDVDAVLVVQGSAGERAYALVKYVAAPLLTSARFNQVHILARNFIFTQFRQIFACACIYIPSYMYSHTHAHIHTHTNYRSDLA